MSNRSREALYDAARGNAEHPSCHLCGLAITPGQAWEHSHTPRPKAWGGTATALAHYRCHRVYTNRIERPAMAKSDRVRQKHIGAWKSRHKLPGGRTDRMKKTMSGRVEPRKNLREKLIAAGLLRHE